MGAFLCCCARYWFWLSAFTGLCCKICLIKLCYRNQTDFLCKRTHHIIENIKINKCSKFEVDTCVSSKVTAILVLVVYNPCPHMAFWANILHFSFNICFVDCFICLKKNRHTVWVQYYYITDFHACHLYQWSMMRGQSWYFVQYRTVLCCIFSDFWCCLSYKPIFAKVWSSLIWK